MNSLTLTRWLREAPITAMCLVVCLALFLLTTRPRQTMPQRLHLMDRWGAVIERAYHPPHDAATSLFQGPIALWHGQWWRIPVSAFHHVDVIHLLSNSIGAAYLGWLLERHRGTRFVVLLVLGAALTALIPEFLLGTFAVGFSGVVCAMFGALCVLRQRDDELGDEFSDEMVYLGGALLALGLLTEALNLSPIANLAHMTGFFIGAFAAYFNADCRWPQHFVRLMWGGLVMSCGLALWLVIHPFWDGTYHWYLAARADNAEHRLAELRQSVAWKPRENRAWLSLADEEQRRGEKLAAWQTLLQGLSFNPTDADLMMRSRRAWRELVIAPGRSEAVHVIRDVFGDLASTWEAQFRADPLPATSPGTDWQSSLAEVDPVIQFPLDQAVDLRLPDVDVSPFQIPPEGDAVEGRRM